MQTLNVLYRCETTDSNECPITTDSNEASSSELLNYLQAELLLITDHKESHLVLIIAGWLVHTHPVLVDSCKLEVHILRTTHALMSMFTNNALLGG